MSAAKPIRYVRQTELVLGGSVLCFYILIEIIKFSTKKNSALDLSLVRSERQAGRKACQQIVMHVSS
jgi:hypothetical protein